MDELPDIIWTIAIVGGLLSGVIGSVIGLIQRSIRYYREQKTKILTGVISEQDVEGIQRIIYKIIIKGKKKVGIPATTFKATRRRINNSTVQRWFRESQYFGKEKYKKSLARHLDWLSNVTIGDIMSSDDLREQLLKVLKSANQNNQAV